MAFQAYIASEGDISLDEAFFGKEHAKRKSLAYKLRFNVYGFFHDELMVASYAGKSPMMQEHRDRYKGLSRQKIAEIYIHEHPHLFRREVDVDSFLKGYDRWVKDTFKDKTE